MADAGRKRTERETKGNQQSVELGDARNGGEEGLGWGGWGGGVGVGLVGFVSWVVGPLIPVCLWATPGCIAMSCMLDLDTFIYLFVSLFASVFLQLLIYS